mgnify:CR=1 FL=1
MPPATLEQVLGSEAHFPGFLKYCTKTLTGENVLFLNACRFIDSTLGKCVGKGVVPQNVKMAFDGNSAWKFKALVAHFVGPGAGTMQINLPAEMEKRALEEAAYSTSPSHLTVLRQLYAEIDHLVTKDILPRFLKDPGSVTVTVATTTEIWNIPGGIEGRKRR